MQQARSCDGKMSPTASFLRIGKEPTLKQIQDIVYIIPGAFFPSLALLESENRMSLFTRMDMQMVVRPLDGGKKRVRVRCF